MYLYTYVYIIVFRRREEKEEKVPAPRLFVLVGKIRRNFRAPEIRDRLAALTYVPIRILA